MVFKVIPLLANDSEGTLLCNSLLPGSGAVIMTVKRCTISYLIAWFVVWAALYLSDVIVSLFWLEYDSGNLQELNKNGLWLQDWSQHDICFAHCRQTCSVCLEMIPLVSPNKIKCLQRAHCTRKIIH